MNEQNVPGENGYVPSAETPVQNENISNVPPAAETPDRAVVQEGAAGAPAPEYSAEQPERQQEQPQFYSQPPQFGQPQQVYQYGAPQYPPQPPQFQPGQPPQFGQQYQQQFVQHQQAVGQQNAQYQQQFSQYRHNRQQEPPAFMQQPQAQYGAPFQPAYQQPYAVPAAQPVWRRLPVAALILAAAAFITFLVIRLINLEDNFELLKYAFEFNDEYYSLYTLAFFLSAWFTYIACIALVFCAAVQYKKGRSSLAGVSYLMAGLSLFILFAVHFLTLSVIMPLAKGGSVRLQAIGIVFAVLYFFTFVFCCAAASGMFKGRGKGAGIVAAFFYIAALSTEFIYSAVYYSRYDSGIPAEAVVEFIAKTLLGAALFVFAAVFRPVQTPYQQGVPTYVPPQQYYR